MTMTRQQLLNGFRMDGEYMTWAKSYHETESFAFANPRKTMKCDECGKPIEPYSLYSLGTRQVYPDAPIYGTWTDKVHLFDCSSYCDTFKEAFKHVPPQDVPGWGDLPLEEKRRLLDEAGIPITEELLNVESVFSGMTCVVVGEFSQSNDSVVAEIESHGGKVLTTITKSTKPTHIVLGSDGVTQYGQKTGRGSKRYKDAMKVRPKPQVVDLAFIQAAIAKGKNIFEKEEKEEEEEEKEEESKAKGSKKRGKQQEKEEEEEEATQKKKQKTKSRSGKMYDEEKLKSMKRNELQKLCKLHSLPANTTNAQMAAALAAL
ncbi:cyclic nucleotide-gated cation channel beta-1 [Balamuthia mandrillaris]